MKRLSASVTLCMLIVMPLATQAGASDVVQVGVPPLSVNALTHYVIDPESGSVEVTVDFLLVNTSSDQRFTEFEELFPVEVIDLIASSASRDLEVSMLPSGSAESVVEDADHDAWLIQLPSVLRPGRQMSITVDWVMDVEMARAGESAAVVNAAYISVPVEPAGRASGLHSVDVTLPAGLTMIRSSGFSLVASRDRDRLMLHDAGSLDPHDPAMIVASNESALTRRTVAGLDSSVEIRGWPDDTEWSDLMAEASASVIPQLASWLGASPVDSFDIREGSSEAYPNIVTGTVVGDRAVLIVESSADAGELARQLADVWLHDTLPEIEWFAPAATASFGSRAAMLFDTSLSGPFVDTVADSDALALVEAIIDDLGPARFAEIVSLVSDGSFTYPGPAAESAPALAADWRTLLDGFEILGDSAVAAEAFTMGPLTPADLSQIERRDIARADFAALEADAGSFELPIWVRQPMAEWNFDTFDARRAEIEESLVAIGLLRDEAGVAGIDLGDFVGDSFEASTTGMAGTDALIEDQRSALEALIEAVDADESNTGLISKVGLRGTDLRADLDAMSVAFEEGDFDATRSISASVIHAIEGSNAKGILRVVIPSTLVIALVSAATALVRARRSANSAGLPEEPGESES